MPPPEEQQRAHRGCPLPWVFGAPRTPQSSSSDVLLLQPPARFGRARATCRAYLGPQPPRPPRPARRPPGSPRWPRGGGVRGGRSPRDGSRRSPVSPSARPAPAAGTAPTPRRAPGRRLHFPSHAPSRPRTHTHAHTHAPTLATPTAPPAVSSEPNGRALRAVAGSGRVLAQQRPLGNVVPAGRQRSR